MPTNRNRVIYTTRRDTTEFFEAIMFLYFQIQRWYINNYVDNNNNNMYIRNRGLSVDRETYGWRDSANVDGRLVSTETT